MIKLNAIICLYALMGSWISAEVETWERCGKIEFNLKAVPWNPEGDSFLYLYLKSNKIDIHKNSLYQLRYKKIPELSRDVVKTHDGKWQLLGSKDKYTKCELVKLVAF